VTGSGRRRNAARSTSTRNAGPTQRRTYPRPITRVTDCPAVPVVPGFPCGGGAVPRQPDGSHDKLEAEQAAAVERILKRDGLWTEVEHIDRGGGIAIVFLCLVAMTGVMIFVWALLVLPVDQPAPEPYFVTTTPTTYGPPGPTGGPIR